MTLPINDKPRVISESWFRFIQYVESQYPNSELTTQFVNGQPVKQIGMPKPNIRFDKVGGVPGVEF